MQHTLGGPLGPPELQCYIVPICDVVVHGIHVSADRIIHVGRTTCCWLATKHACIKPTTILWGVRLKRSLVGLMGNQTSVVALCQFQLHLTINSYKLGA